MGKMDSIITQKGAFLDAFEQQCLCMIQICLNFKLKVSKIVFRKKIEKNIVYWYIGRPTGVYRYIGSPTVV